MQASHVVERRDLLATVADMQPASGFDDAIFGAYLDLAVAVVDRAQRDARGEGMANQQTEQREHWRKDAQTFLASGCGLIGDFLQSVVADRSAPIAPLAKRSGVRVA